MTKPTISFSHPYRPTYLSVDRHGEKTKPAYDFSSWQGIRFGVAQSGKHLGGYFLALFSRNWGPGLTTSPELITVQST
jgi:hypothetical protein